MVIGHLVVMPVEIVDESRVLEWRRKLDRGLIYVLIDIHSDLPVPISCVGN